MNAAGAPASRPSSAAGPACAGPAPLSYGQQRIWVLSQLSPDGAALNLVMAVRLRGPLSGPALRQAFDDIAARHQVLRSVIAVRDGVPVQEYAPDGPVPCHLVSLAGLPEEAARTHAEQLLAAAARRPFDLAHGPLVRVSIIALH